MLNTSKERNAMSDSDDRKAVMAALKNAKRDYLDLMEIHWKTQETKPKPPAPPEDVKWGEGGLLLAILLWMIGGLAGCGYGILQDIGAGILSLGGLVFVMWIVWSVTLPIRKRRLPIRRKKSLERYEKEMQQWRQRWQEKLDHRMSIHKENSKKYNYDGIIPSKYRRFDFPDNHGFPCNPGSHPWASGRMVCEEQPMLQLLYYMERTYSLDDAIAMYEAETKRSEESARAAIRNSYVNPHADSSRMAQAQEEANRINKRRAAAEEDRAASARKAAETLKDIDRGLAGEHGRYK